jgi:translation initiation factor 2 subunit 3
MPSKKEAQEGKQRLVPEVNIGIVGHVDHGKTTLTSVLTGKWTDTHSEEIKRGITIRLGYADFTVYKCKKCPEPQCYCTTAKCPTCFGDAEPLRMISIVDAPGHETLMTTVLSGTSIMDGALLVIAADEKCPQPQTREHLTALELTGIRNVVIVQNKIDAVSEEQALANYKQIKAFVKGTVAESAPIVPVSANQRVNIDALLQAMEKQIPTPKRDPSKEPKMFVARSFDINKPGTAIAKLSGGIIGGSLVQGTLKVGDEIEIRPGVKREGRQVYEPVRSKITGLQKASQNVEEAGPGGLLGVMTGLDPALTKSDSLGGNVLGLPGKLPPVMSTIDLKVKLLERVVGSKEELNVQPIRSGEPLMLTVGVVRTVGTAEIAKGGVTRVSLKIPVCASKGDRAAVSRQVLSRWRLVGIGEVV